MKSKKIINFAITMGKKHKRLIYNALGLILIIFFYSVFFQATYCWMRFGSPTFNGDWGSFIYSLPFNFVPFLIIAIAALWSVWLTRNIAVLWKKITLDLLMASCIVIIVNILFLLTTGLEINWGGTVFNGIMIWMGIEFWAVSLQRQRALIRESLLLKENAAHKLQLLQSYVNPHFLFNSLDMLCSMIEVDEKKQSLEFIENLTAYYRGMLRRKNVMKVTVKDELETVFCYLKIVSQHYGDNLEVKVTGDRDTDMMIVPFSIAAHRKRAEAQRDIGHDAYDNNNKHQGGCHNREQPLPPQKHRNRQKHGDGTEISEQHVCRQRQKDRRKQMRQHVLGNDTGTVAH